MDMDNDDFLEEELVKKFINLTNSDESLARYMLQSHRGDLNHAIDSYFTEKSKIDHRKDELDSSQIMLQGLEFHDTNSKDIEFSSPKDKFSSAPIHLSNAFSYLKSCNQDVGIAMDQLVGNQNNTLFVQEYLLSCSNNISVAMHRLLEASDYEKRNLLEASDYEKINYSYSDDGQLQLAKAAKEYLDFFKNDLQWSMNVFMEFHCERLDGLEFQDHSAQVKNLLAAAGGEIDIAINILLDLHDPLEDVESNKKLEHAEEYLAAFSNDGFQAVNALIESGPKVQSKSVSSHSSICSKIYLDYFNGNYNEALQALLDLTSSCEYIPSDEAVTISKDMSQKTCGCGNDDIASIKHYFYENQFVGIYCSRCKQEYLISDVLKETDWNESNPYFILYNSKLYKNDKLQLNNFDSALLKMINVSNINALKEGDVFGLKRPVYTHCGIVTKVIAANQSFEGIHYQKRHGKAVIVKETLEFQKDDAVSVQCYKGIEDNPKLVIARAFSYIGDHGYHLFRNNCEHFASFCKTGLRESSQVDQVVHWVKEKLNGLLSERTLKMAFTFSANVFSAKGAQNILKKTKAIQSGVVIVMEGKTIFVEISKLSNERSVGNITLLEFLKKSFACIISGLVDVTMKVGASIYGGSLGACVGRLISGKKLSTSPISLFLGSVLGGKVGTLPEKTLGNIIGNFLADTIIGCLPLYDDRAVTKINDLHPGDHIIFNPGIHHPRCHGIVTGHNSIKHITLLRSTYANGVVEEEIQFIAPFYKVLYDENECWDVMEVIDRGRTKLGINEYNLITYNCKHFAIWCKKR